MAGIKVRKSYVTADIASSYLNEDWLVLVLGVTSGGPVEPTYLTSYDMFINTFGTAVSGYSTHQYVQQLLANGVPVMFKRITNNTQPNLASLIVKSDNEVGTTPADYYVKFTALNTYSGDAGKNIALSVVPGEYLKSESVFQIYYNNVLVESYSLGVPTDNSAVSVKNQFKTFVDNYIYGNSGIKSNYVSIELLNPTTIPESAVLVDDLDKTALVLTGTATAEDYISVLTTYTDSETGELKPFWNDAKLHDAMNYYPNVRLVSVGGVVAADTATQNTINKNLGKFVVDCGTSFRALIDYPMGTEDITSVVRNFAYSEIADGVDTSIYAYFGDWGYTSGGYALPGSLGFLTALGNNNYTPYSRRVAGTTFRPSFTSAYDDIYIDGIKDWQSELSIQLNPIVVVDAQGNLAVMGSSTLCEPPAPLTARSPKQALDVLMVGDHITNLLNRMALDVLEGTLDRLMLDTLSNNMSRELERFVESKAITRYDLQFSVEQLGKLNIVCNLYFAIGLEEVELLVTSTYDTDIYVS